MCWMAAVPLALTGAQQIGGMITGGRMLAAQTEAGRQQAIEIMRQTNIRNADLTLQAKSLRDEAAAEVTSQNMQRVQAMGSIRAAIGESNLEGNSMDRVQRVTEGQFIREANMVNENYRRDYQAIFAQQIGAIDSAESQIKAIYNAEAKPKSKLQQILDPLAVVGSQAASMYVNSRK